MGLGESKEKKNYNYPRFSSFSIVIHQISCGFEHAGFIAQNGFIYMMGKYIFTYKQNIYIHYASGSNENGRLGISNISIDYSYSPCLVETLSRYS
jgi:X-linked retinitis pigmentosa GTPase regulator